MEIKIKEGEKGTERKNNMNESFFTISQNDSYENLNSKEE